MGGGRRRPTTSRESPEWSKEAAVVFWTLVDWRANERVEWEEKEPVKVMT
jgi:hypothetical protein